MSNLSYSRHDKRGGRPSLKVTYGCGLTTYQEWICFEHQGYARRKAEDWWRKRAPGQPVPRSVNEALTLSRSLARPSHISVRPSGRYFEITGYRFDPCTHSTTASAPSASATTLADAGPSTSSIRERISSGGVRPIAVPASMSTRLSTPIRQWGRA